MFNKSFTWFLGRNSRGKFQVILIFSSSMSPRETFSASPVSICAPAEPASPNASRQNCSRADALRVSFLDQIEREGARLLVIVLFENLKAVDDGADRTDQVMADARAQQRRQIEGTERERAGSGWTGDG